jgi:hypothetical protein
MEGLVNRTALRIWLGMIATQPTVIIDPAITLQLWRNEVTRTIADRSSLACRNIYTLL